MSNEMYTFGLNGVESKLVDLRRNFISSEEREQELTKLGLIAQKEIVKLTPVDTGHLRSSITVEVQNSQKRAFVGTNIEYAQAVEQGHEQKAMFLPEKYLDTVKGRQYLGSNEGGIMLKAKFIQGAHMFEKGMQIAAPKLDAEIKRWLSSLSARFNG
jgi:hypothetical protein